MALKLTLGGVSHALDIVRLRPDLVVAVDGCSREIVDHGANGSRRIIEVDGRRFEFIEARDGNRSYLRFDNRTVIVDFVDPRDAADDQGSASDEIRAPMPGVVVELHKHVGDRVAFGETVLTIESMKLQTNLTAPRDGTIARIGKNQNESFEKDEVIVSLAPEEGD